MKIDLDELERQAKALVDAPVAFRLTESGSEQERASERVWRQAEHEYRTAAQPATTRALIARIRELEELATQALNHSDLSPRETREGWAILRQGVVLP